MSLLTNILRLIKPELGDTINPSVFATNFDIIDEHIGGLEDKVDTMQSTLINTKNTADDALNTGNLALKTANAALPKTGGTVTGTVRFYALPTYRVNGQDRQVPFCRTNVVSFEWVATPQAALKIYVDATLVATIPGGFKG